MYYSQVAWYLWGVKRPSFKRGYMWAVAQTSALAVASAEGTKCTSDGVLVNMADHSELLKPNMPSLFAAGGLRAPAFYPVGTVAMS